MGEWIYSPDPALERAVAAIRQKHPSLYPDSLDRTFRLLKKLGNPHLLLPPVFHVAGTNGKGSTLAFLQAMLEAGGMRVHKFISPHLVRFEERIVLGGKDMDSGLLLDMIEEVDRVCGDDEVSFFEFFTALAFLAFSRDKADTVLLETGLGGTFDATNVIEGDIVSIITRISYDHCRVLGAALPGIARHKAGIIKQGRPCIVARQKDESVGGVFEKKAAERGSPLFKDGRDWKTTLNDEGFLYEGADLKFSLPLPALPGAHQVENAGAAITALRHSPFAKVLSRQNLEKAMRDVVWPGRLQRLTKGILAARLPEGWELWVDGAHNDSGAEVLAEHIGKWDSDKPLHIVTAMKKTKERSDFYPKLLPFAKTVTALDAPSADMMVAAQELCDYLHALGYASAATAENLESALATLAFSSSSPGRILVTGSLYLAGHVLKANG